MEREGGNRERMRKCRESISLHFLIFSPFPPHFLILSSFPRSPAARLQRFVQPCCVVIKTSLSGLVYDCIPVEGSWRRGSEFLLLFFVICCAVFFVFWCCQCWGIVSVVLEVWLLSYLPVVACTYMSQEAAMRSLEGTALGNKTTWYNNHHNVLVNSF